MIRHYNISTYNRPIEVFKHWQSEGYLELNPHYQRGDVWTLEKRINLIKSLLLGIPIFSVIVNDRFSSKWKEDSGKEKMVVIDGKQRITTFLMFLNNDLLIPRNWVINDNTERRVYFNDLDKPTQRRIKGTTVGVCESTLETLEEEEEVYNLVNYGGVPHEIKKI
jgi:hypothetical protein